MKKQRTVALALSFAAALLVSASLSAQAGPNSQTKHFKLAGTVKSVNSRDHQLIVQHGDIPGFMAAMTMPYNVKKDEDLAKISPGDRIQSDVVVGDKESYLQNVKVIGHGKEKQK